MLGLACTAIFLFGFPHGWNDRNASAKEDLMSLWSPAGPQLVGPGPFTLAHLAPVCLQITACGVGV
jgi:hypothetical protein